MDNKLKLKNTGNILGIISLTIALVIFLPILNWFFKITPYQSLQGLPLLVAPFLSLIGFVFGIISIKISSNKFGKCGIVSNVVLFLLPSLYWYLGTFIFGP